MLCVPKKKKVITNIIKLQQIQTATQRKINCLQLSKLGAHCSVFLPEVSLNLFV